MEEPRSRIHFVSRPRSALLAPWLLALALALLLSTAARTQTVGSPIPVGTNPRPMALNPVTNKIYVANQGTNLAPGTTLTVIDRSTGQTSTVTLANTPSIVVVNPVTNKIYVGEVGPGGSGSIQVLDGSTNNVIATLSVSAGGLAVNPVTNKIYAVGRGVTVINGATDTVEQPTSGTPIGLGPVAVNPVTNTIYAANLNMGGLFVLNATNGVTATVQLTMIVFPTVLAVNSVTNMVYVGAPQGVFVVDGATNNTTLVTPPVLNGSTDDATSIAINPVTNKIYVGYRSGILANTVIGEIDGVTNQETLIPSGLSPASVAVNVFENQVYAANLSDGTVTIIDGETHASRTVSVGTLPSAISVDPLTNNSYVLNQTWQLGLTTPPVPGSVQSISGVPGPSATISAGSDPFAVAVDPVLNKAYLANDGSNDVTLIDGPTNTTTKISAGTNPFAVAVDPITGKAFVANQGSNDVTMIDGATNATTTIPVGTAPEAVAVNSVTGTVYVANSGSNNVAVINEATNATVSVATGSTPVALAVNSVTNRIYVADKGSNDVTVINGATNTASSIAVGSSPDAVAVNPVTNKIYVANQGDNDVTVIDGATGATSRVSVGTTPVAVAVNPLTNKIYVADEGSDDVTVIDGSTNSVTFVVAGTLPDAVTVNLASNKIYVANSGSNDLTVIDGLDNTTSTFAGGTGPVSVAVNPVTSRIYVADIGDEATVLTEQVTQPTPLVTKITPFTGNITTGPAPTFTFTTSSSYAPAAPPVLGVFYQVDTLQGPWLAASGSEPNFSGQTQPLTVGTHVLYAYPLDSQNSLSGNLDETVGGVGQYITGSLTAYFFAVAPVGTQTTLTSDHNPSQVGNTVNLMAMVAPTPPATGTPTGTVDFLDGTELLGSATLDSTGHASLATSTLAAGSHQITAIYEGGANFAASTSVPLTQTVNENFTFSANPSSLTITHGQSGTSTLTITPAGGADTIAITFSCTGLPTGSTCAFSPTSVTPGINPATTTMTIQTAASAAVPAPFGVPALPPSLVSLLELAAALGIGTALLKRRRMRWNWAPTVCLLALVGLAAVITACGGGGGTAPPTNSALTGSFTVTVHATAGTVDKTTTIMLTVN